MNNTLTKAIESLKYHPDASHVEPGERDAWNRALDQALVRVKKLVLGKPVAWYRDPSPLEPYGDDAEGEAVYGRENPNMPGMDEGWLPAYSAMASLIEVPVKLEIPPPGADSHDVAYAEGWNGACDAFFGGKPPAEPLVITVTQTPQQGSANVEVPTPQALEISKALNLLGAYRPCEHLNADTTLGDGKTWAKCEDCGNEFRQDNWERKRQIAAEFDAAMAVLGRLADATKQPG